MDYLKTRKQLAQEYGISRSTLYRRLKEAGIEMPRGMLNPLYQCQIYQVLGYPQGREAVPWDCETLLQQNDTSLKQKNTKWVIEYRIVLKAWFKALKTVGDCRKSRKE